ncbi:hypothetical protein DRE_02644 [Drechslerella stenobrocha 248]|uniref:Dickkopf N-terminal cysteine-rich domain-containing protein n=1 Tax=Drechslerella stenobrocha 248 TaxID=1043628 RepID=W7IFX4_9PEZI|nr:hypothetical protein DRE_02644 [Drechslerella stenobrocha 248]
MRSSLINITVATLFASTVSAQASAPPRPSVTAAPGSLPLGAECSSSEQCAGGADCYATNFMLIPSCGNFQAACTSDAQCAFNTCNQGFCNGLKPSSSSADPSGPATAPPRPSVTAAPGSLPLGAPCSSSEQCAGGADCYATNSFLIPSCGNFQAACTSDAQCAFNTCNQGFCNGQKASSSADPSATAPPQPSVTAAPGSLPLGAECSSNEQCAGGAECYATNFMLLRRCGNFQAGCASDAQCAFNTCNQGACNGLLPSSSATATGPGYTVTSPPTNNGTTGGSGSGTGTTTAPPNYTGAAVAAFEIPKGAVAVAAIIVAGLAL